ncbi:MAG: hypothetical protein IT393_03615 [Nitrospirae bacterium]|nr:hypothetical protein [Nitrospirota bacterium]
MNEEKKRVEEWISTGAKEEDAATLWTFLMQTSPYYNHYHNALKTGDQWNQAGLDDYVGLVHVTGKSSILWALDIDANDWSWSDVRAFYGLALTSSTETERQANFAKTFKGLGHLMHLIQDAAQPAHVRNDAHPLDGLEVLEGLETWAKKNRLLVTGIASSPSFPGISLATSLGSYPPMTQLWDTDLYTGSNPSTSLTLGLVEYTNANFASDDTIFTESFPPDHRKYFPYPRKASMELYEQDNSGNGDLRNYFRKIYDGETVEHFAVAGRLYKYFGEWPEVQRNFVSLDNQCHKDYAEKLIPRAVGYSAALIDYFFRGELDFVVDEGDKTDGAKGIRVYNLSDEEMAGTFSLYYDTADGNRHPLGSWELLIAPQGISPTLSFIFPGNNIEEHRYILVFRGMMGMEQGAVAGYIHGGGWREEWDAGLHDNHNWVYSETDLAGQNPNNGVTINEIVNGRLVKENIRYAGSDMARLNEAYIGVADDFINGTYYLGGYAIPYDFTDRFPIEVTTDARLNLKIDAMSINEQIPAQSCAVTEWPTGDYQGIVFYFRFGNDSTRKMVLTTSGHESLIWPTTVIPLDVDYSVKIHDMLSAWGGITEPVYLDGINIVQNMWNLCDPSQVEHSQHMEVDYIRIEKRQGQP